jgi:multicomponent Na+:H+ antiporter subunit G
MNGIFQILGVAAVVVGTAFSTIGIVGMLRLPDVYTRLHATGKVSTFGVVLLTLGAACFGVVGVGKAIVLCLFLLISGPVVSHAIGSAAYRIGIPMARSVRDDLAAQRIDSR